MCQYPDSRPPGVRSRTVGPLRFRHRPRGRADRPKMRRPFADLAVWTRESDGARKSGIRTALELSRPGVFQQRGRILDADAGPDWDTHQPVLHDDRRVKPSAILFHAQLVFLIL